MAIVSHDLIRLRIARHRDDGRHMVELSDERGCRNTVELRHDNILRQAVRYEPASSSEAEEILTMRTKSYLSKFILLTATTPSTATSIVHPKTCKNLLESFRLTASSSTSNTRGGTAQPGTNVDRRTRNFCALPVGLEPDPDGDDEDIIGVGPLALTEGADAEAYSPVPMPVLEPACVSPSPPYGPTIPLPCWFCCC